MLVSIPVLSDGDPEAGNQVATTTATTTEKLVNLYYYSPEKDIDKSGELRCSVTGLTATPYHIAENSDIISETIELLLSGAGGDSIRPRDITGFPLPEVSLVGVHVRDGVAVVALDDPTKAMSGDACRANVLQEQLRATIRQFPSVAEVEFIPESLFRP